jgi:hypothetical protein
MSNTPSVPETPQPSAGYALPQKRNAGLYVNGGVLCAVISLFVLPEVFGSAAIILGGYAWRIDCNETKNRGLWVIIIGIITMLAGIYYTSFFGLYNILP